MGYNMVFEQAIYESQQQFFLLLLLLKEINTQTTNYCYVLTLLYARKKTPHIWIHE